MALQHANPGDIVSLRPLGSELTAAKTAALVKTEHFEAVRLVVRAGTEIPTHQVPGNITLHCLEGRIAFGLADKILEMSVGDWVYLEGGAPHSLRGIEDATLLLTILLPAATQGE
ncbi:cupin domain-containing protein [Terrihabitans sp. B22-R8]|uniref:cupin domain-containing protein n=1 Tax=Terrihabitans sp. B22-R8 TaxID=3425128 RepID=UPI00403C5B45